MEQTIKDYIRGKLEELAKDQTIRIIAAIESGSRAWGFPSKDSDYDVRFIYTRDLNYYLSIGKQRDVIETPIAHDDRLDVEFDMNGWDIKKAIYLAMRGNAVVHEWLTSPIQYIVSEPEFSELKKFVSETADLRSYFYFYRNYMRQPWSSYAEDKSQQIKIKHYCYVLRCALSLNWLEQNQSAPPMDVPSLLSGMELDQPLIDDINALITAKETSTEADVMPRNQSFDTFIDDAINIDRKRPEKEKLEALHSHTANALFRKIVLGN